MLEGATPRAEVVIVDLIPLMIESILGMLSSEFCIEGVDGWTRGQPFGGAFDQPHAQLLVDD
jgi:hypothetical protein